MNINLLEEVKDNIEALQALLDDMVELQARSDNTASTERMYCNQLWDLSTNLMWLASDFRCDLK